MREKRRPASTTGDPTPWEVVAIGAVSLILGVAVFVVSLLGRPVVIDPVIGLGSLVGGIFLAITAAVGIRELRDS